MTFTKTCILKKIFKYLKIKSLELINEKSTTSNMSFPPVKKKEIDSSTFGSLQASI
jgi:hypothetical protein